MKKIVCLLLVIAFVACSQESENFPQYIELPQTGIYLIKRDWVNGEIMDIYIYPSYLEEPPYFIDYINSIEYFIDGNSIGKTNSTPFYISYLLNFSLGKHDISAKIVTKDKYVILEAKDDSFNINEVTIQGYTDNQKYILQQLIGNWFDTQFISNGLSTSLTFTNQYEKPQQGKHGECTFQQSNNGLSADIAWYFYGLSSDASSLLLYNKETNQLFKEYSFTMKNENEFLLKDNNLSLPYIFVKQ